MNPANRGPSSDASLFELADNPAADESSSRRYRGSRHGVAASPKDRTPRYQSTVSSMSSLMLEVREVLGSETCDGNQHAERTAVARPCGLVSIVVVPSKRVAHGR